jgi:putative addiction module component (TIGR02574 family)
MPKRATSDSWPGDDHDRARWTASLTPAQVAELDRRIAADAQHPERAVPWEPVMARILGAKCKPE